MSKPIKFDRKCPSCRLVTEWLVVGFRAMKNGKTKYVAKCQTCGRVNTVHEDKVK